MSKELEALEKLTNYKCSCMSEKIECKNIIEIALKDHEKLKIEHEFLKEYYNELSKEYHDLRGQLNELEKANYFLGIDVFTFIEIMNPFHNIYVWDSHNKQVVKLSCFGARRTYDGKQIYINNAACTAWLELKDYDNTWSLNKVILEKKWLNNGKEVKDND